MNHQLSFKSHPIQAILSLSNLFFNGATKAIGVYFDNSADDIVSISCDIFNNETQFIQLNDQIINKLRNDAANKLWVSPTLLGIVESNKKIIQLSLEDELDNSVLLLKFENEFDHKFDLLFIFFNKDKNTFDISAKQEALNTSSKNIIAHLLYNSLSAFITNQQQNKTLFYQIIKSTSILQDNIEKANEELNSTKNQLKESLNSLLSNILTPIEKLNNVSFVITAASFEILQNFKGSSEELKSIVNNAASIALNLSLGKNIEILPEHFIFENYQTKQEAKEVSKETETFNRYSKTIQVLDRFEKAARQLLDKNQQLTSKNLGLQCNPSISAPAISDAIKNHRKKIISLLEMHPEKWPIIRNEFKPILNILPPENKLPNIHLGA
jgi:hypothetical protein